MGIFVYKNKMKVLFYKHSEKILGFESVTFISPDQDDLDKDLSENLI